MFKRFIQTLTIILFIGIYQITYSQNLDELNQQAKNLVDQKKYSEAISLFNQIEKVYPNYPDKIKNKETRSWCYQQLGNYDQAIIGYLDCINSDPSGEDTDEALLNLGFCYKETKQYTQATGIFDKLTKNKNSRFLSGGYHNLGLCAQYLKDYDTAINAYKNFKQSSPDNQEYMPSVLLNLGYCYKEIHDNDNAITNFKEFISRYSTTHMYSPDAYFNLGVCYKDKHYPLESRDTFLQFVISFSTTKEYSADAYYNVAYMSQVWGDFVKALDYYKLYLQYYPQGRFAKNVTENLPECFLVTKMPTNDIYTTYLEMINNKNNSPDAIARARVNLAEEYNNNRRYISAISTAMPILEMKNIFRDLYAEAYIYIGASYYDMKKYDIAINHYKCVTSLNISDEWNTIGDKAMANAYYEKKDYDSAIICYQRILDIHNTNKESKANTLYKIGECYLSKGEYEKASNAYQEVLSKYSIYKSTANSAKGKLEIIKNKTEQK